MAYPPTDSADGKVSWVVTNPGANQAPNIEVVFLCYKKEPQLYTRYVAMFMYGVCKGMLSRVLNITLHVCIGLMPQLTYALDSPLFVASFMCLPAFNLQFFFMTSPPF
jgi:hypothetical protein